MACRPIWAAPDRQRPAVGSPSRPAVAVGSPHRPAEEEEEEEEDTHRETDTHRVGVEVEVGSYQGAVDRSWTPSSNEISWQRAC